MKKITSGASVKEVIVAGEQHSSQKVHTTPFLTFGGIGAGKSTGATLTPDQLKKYGLLPR